MMMNKDAQLYIVLSGELGLDVQHLPMYSVVVIV